MFQDVPWYFTQCYGIVSGFAKGRGVVNLPGTVEKTDPALTSTTLAVVALYFNYKNLL
jgi:hypothetical protein